MLPLWRSVPEASAPAEASLPFQRRTSMSAHRKTVEL
jgi:hypothetical protein